jgi:hypothetical protein
MKLRSRNSPEASLAMPLEGHGGFAAVADLHTVATWTPSLMSRVILTRPLELGKQSS